MKPSFISLIPLLALLSLCLIKKLPYKEIALGTTLSFNSKDMKDDKIDKGTNKANIIAGSSNSNTKLKESTNDCSWCQKYNPTSSTNHRGKSYTKLKEYSKKANKEKVNIISEEIAITALVG
jgi:hypothetical protein